MEGWRVRPGKTLSLHKINTGSTDGAPGDKPATIAVMESLKVKIGDLQERLWAENDQSLLVVFQAMDTAGKDSTIRTVFSGVNPQGVPVTSFKTPTSHELAHDFLWRIHQAVPGNGEIGVFNRSHYEDVLVVRVKELVPEKIWRPRYEMINEFETLLANNRTRVIKFFLHISKQEQAERLQARLDDPKKRWKFNHGDLLERARWDEYQDAYQEAIEKTSTGTTPWFVIPSDNKWFRNWAVARTVCDTLEEMDPHFPEPADLDPNMKFD